MPRLAPCRPRSRSDRHIRPSLRAPLPRWCGRPRCHGHRSGRSARGHRSSPPTVHRILNIHKPRDRSHYERFAAYHESFYRSVEATSVTPFSPRGARPWTRGHTRGGFARQRPRPHDGPKGAGEILKERQKLDFVVNCLADRAKAHATMTGPEAEQLRQVVRDRANDLFDEWSKIAMELNQAGVALQYHRK